MLNLLSLVMDLVSERRPEIFNKTREGKIITPSLKFSWAGIHPPAQLIAGEKITVFGRTLFSSF
jgi:hypothetical protein